MRLCSRSDAVRKRDAGLEWLGSSHLEGREGDAGSRLSITKQLLGGERGYWITFVVQTMSFSVCVQVLFLP
jgi:hypothetical protein